MVLCKTRKWGNSLGMIIPSGIVKSLNLKEDQKIIVEINGVENPLKEMFGFAKKNPITKKEFVEMRKLFEGKEF